MLRPQTLLDLTAFYPAVELVDPHWSTNGLGWFLCDYAGREERFGARYGAWQGS